MIGGRVGGALWAYICYGGEACVQLHCNTIHCLSKTPKYRRIRNTQRFLDRTGKMSLEPRELLLFKNEYLAGFLQYGEERV